MDDALDRLRRGRLALRIVDEGGAEILAIEGDALHHGLSQGGPLLRQLLVFARAREQGP